MDINTYLKDLSKKLEFSSSECEKIDNSFKYLNQKIWSVFQNKLKDVRLFGSFDRDTALPTNIDKLSDVDVMIIFKKNEFQPQTYLNHLQNFGKRTYPRSEKFPNHPTIMIELFHLKFELVPAYIDEGFWGNGALKIPGKPDKELKWIDTDPDAFKAALFKKNNENKGLTISIIKILKYWNVINNYPFRPYALDEIAVIKNVTGTNLKEYFYDFVNELSRYQKSEEEKKAVKTLFETVRRLKILEKENIQEYIEQEMNAFLPMPLM